MNQYQCAFVRSILLVGKSLSFPEMIEIIGTRHYVRLWHELELMIDNGLLNRWCDETRALLFIHAPTPKGIEAYNASSAKETLAFDQPVQKSLGL
jgi:hypothetical protein